MANPRKKAVVVEPELKNGQLEHRGSLIIVEPIDEGFRVVVAKNGLYCTEFNATDIDDGIDEAKEYIDGGAA